MKSIVFILLTSFILNLPVYQRFLERRADRKYEIENFTDAIKMYTRLVSADSTNVRYLSRLARSYMAINDYPNAEKYFSMGVVLDNADPVDYFYYAESLKSNSKHGEALVWMKKYNNSVPEPDIRAIRHLEYPDYANIMEKEPGSFDITLLDINSDYTHFGVAFKSDYQVVYSTSDHDRRSFLRRDNPRDNTNFLSLYTADIDNWELVNPRPFDDNLASWVHDGPATFSKDGREMFFTRNIYQRRSEAGGNINHLMIFRAEYDGENWINPRPLSFNSEHYSCGHPSLSQDGSRLYFVSDMPGGYGKTDIYYSERTGNEWSKPVNLGPEINTPGREMFPFIHKDGTLYFSSDGHVTLGGLDIFYATPGDNGYNQPKNIGLPINSPADDFAFVFSNDGINGFFSSNRRLYSSDDIYHFKYTPALPVAVPLFVEIMRFAKDVEIDPLEKAIPGDFEELFISDFSSPTLKGGVVALGPEKANLVYSPEYAFYGTDTILYKICDNRPGEPGCSESYIVINVIDFLDQTYDLYFDFDRDNIRPEAADLLDKEILTILVETPEINIVISAHTDSRGSDAYNEVLSEQRANAVVNYLTDNGIDARRISRSWHGARLLRNHCEPGVECTEEEHRINRRAEITFTLD